ncbi:MAG TPA: tetratricopeptide repeat protein [Thiolapillus brandeum]|uniref:Tetratricopeptide repeat protein n=1 Tax=Thiolapillus brandeum TaxID=1076588 RepID=A0A7C5MX32_9GAMM|nr:tetratricopeptide repeat protein [Thiolapillus brandeum]
MDPDLVFDYLAGEIGSQRGRASAAYEHLLRAATRAKDPVAAAQATQLAIRLNEADKAVRAAELWVEYDPNSIKARELRMILALRTGDLQGALDQAEAVLRISDALGEDGFLQLATVLSMEKLDTKIRLMEALAARHPEDARARYAVALVASQRKRFALAEKALDEAIRLDPRWDKPHLLRARILGLQGRNEAAEKTLRTAARAHPTAMLFQALGQMLTRQKRYEEALQAYEQALKLKPDNPDLISTVGLLAIQTRKWDPARRSWLRLAREGNYHKQQEAWYFLGQIEELQKHPGKAIEYYRKVKEGRLLADARLRLAILEGQQGNLEEASRLFRELRLTNPQQAVQIYVTEAQLYKEQGQPERAMTIYDEAIAANPGNADLLYARGLLAADLGRIEQAERDLRAVLELQPGDADALNALGYTLAEQTDRLAEAYGYIRQALQQLPDSAAVLDSMGWVLYRMGKKREALEYLQKAAGKLQDGEIAAHLGEVLWSLDRKDEARRVWREALEFAPDNPKLRKTIERHR